jgi:hypothetical protein
MLAHLPLCSGSAVHGATEHIGAATSLSGIRLPEKGVSGIWKTPARDIGDRFDNFIAATDCNKLPDNTTLFCLNYGPSSSGPDMSVDQTHDLVTRT